jgi:hypothetical protein
MNRRCLLGQRGFFAPLLKLAKVLRNLDIFYEEVIKMDVGDKEMKVLEVVRH